MKYFLTIVFGFVSATLMLILAFSVYSAVTDDPFWWLVSLGILGTAVVSVLITTASFAAAKDY